MKYKEAKIFGKDEDGYYLGVIVQIETSKEYDILDISNRKPNLWVLNLFSGYRQIGKFKVDKPHTFNERDNIIVKKEDGIIIEVKTEEVEE